MSKDLLSSTKPDESSTEEVLQSATAELKNLATLCGEGLVTTDFLTLIQAQQQQTIDVTDLTGDTESSSEEIPE